MGENEQGGMLRTVTVIGLIAIIAATVIFAVTGLKGSMNKNTDTAVGSVARTMKPYSGDQSIFKPFNLAQSGWNGPRYRMPFIGEIPPGYWRDEVLQVTPVDHDMTIQIDVNDYFDKDHPDGYQNDFQSQTNITYTDMATGEVLPQANITTLKANTKYMLRIQYFNGNDKSLWDATEIDYNTALIINVVDGKSPVNMKLENLEAAVYADKYHQ